MSSLNRPRSSAQRVLACDATGSQVAEHCVLREDIERHRDLVPVAGGLPPILPCAIALLGRTGLNVQLMSCSPKNDTSIPAAELIISEAFQEFNWRPRRDSNSRPQD